MGAFGETASVLSDGPILLEFRAQVLERVREVRERIAAAQTRAGQSAKVTIVAVTKTHGAEAVDAAFHAGLTDVGENRVQEALAKMNVIALPMRWHLIGHLQRNKVKTALQFDLFHAVDSMRLAEALEHVAAEGQRVQDVLLQVNVSGESTKGGVTPTEIEAVSDQLHGYHSLRVRGIMTMAPFDADESVLRSVFSGARALNERLAAAGHPATELSMGMSGDYEIAVQEGATMVRLGTVLFGSRAG